MDGRMVYVQSMFLLQQHLRLHGWMYNACNLLICILTQIWMHMVQQAVALLWLAARDLQAAAEALAFEWVLVQSMPFIDVHIISYTQACEKHSAEWSAA